MIVFNADERLLQDIARRVNVRLVIATDEPFELQDEREMQFIGKWFTPAPSDAVSLEIDSMLMLADLGTHVILSGGEVLELDAPQPEAGDDEEEWQDEEDDNGRDIFL